MSISEGNPRDILDTPATADRTAPPPQKVRVAIIGCGAVAQQFHMPVLAGHEHVELVAFVDRNTAAAEKLAVEYRVPSVFADAEELDPAAVDAAVVATPPFHHAPCTVALAQRGIHVFVEKPMTTALTGAEAMVEAAEAAGVVLSVGTFRRLLPSTRMLRALVDSEWLGRPLRFDLRGGSIYGWPAATLGNMRKDLAGGGVLMDIGPHVLDQILFVLGGEAELLEYRDNALGGIETDCALELQLQRPSGVVGGHVELSRLRRLRNTLQIECERGRLEVATNERYDIAVYPHDLTLRDAIDERLRPYRLETRWADEPETPWYEPFRVEIDDWIDAIRHGRTPQLSGRSALPVVKLIEQCYQQAKRFPEPWVEQGLPPTALENASQASGVATPASDGAARRVLITGATGFIGCRTAELLQLGQGWQVRALVHSPANAARLARLPVEMVMGDLQNEEDCRRIVAGCDAVVHCGIGTAYGQRDEIFKITVGGTEKLAAAALAAGVQRFVHLSTMSVYGSDVTGTLDEATPVRPAQGDDYGESKAAAEQAVARAVEQGLPAVTLRLSTVYGPHAPLINVGPIKRLLAGQLVLPRSAAELPSNTVYIDNVVDLIARALEAPEEQVKGEIFAVSQGDELTCGEFYRQLTDALGLELPIVDDDAPLATSAAKAGVLQSWYQGTRTVMASPEMRELLRRGLNTDPLGRLPRYLLERSPRLKNWLRRKMKLGEPEIYVRPQPIAPPPLRVRPLPAQLSVAKARRVLGYEPAVSRERSMELTAAWIRHSNLLSS